MFDLIETLHEKLPYDCCTDTELALLIEGSPQRRHGLVKRALAQKKLIQVRRGLYSLPQKYQRRGLNLFDLAGRIYGPSYISFLSALSHHGWIPEAVTTVTSATSKRAKTFTTPLGVFSYTHVPLRYALLGVERVEIKEGAFLLASPWRAILDYIYAYNPRWKGLASMQEDLRIEDEKIASIPWHELAELEPVYACRRVSQFLLCLKKARTR